VCEGYVAFVERIQRTQPECPIYFVSITPTPSRWKYWPIANEANCLVREHTRLVKALHFIDLTAPLLGCDGMPDASLYRLDRLHPNARGYAVWTAVIKPILEADLLSV
jgi:lysophospholipase L1-like esterase